MSRIAAKPGAALGVAPREMPSLLAPRTLDELLRVPADALGRVDIARMDVLCATGLPGAESLDVESAVATVDAWARVVAEKTAAFRPFFGEHAADFEHSEPLWRMYCLARILEREYGIHYCLDERDLSKPARWESADRYMLFGLIGRWRHGTCASLPLLLVAVGRRLGYPLRLVRSPGHVFCRWDAPNHPNPVWRERRNIEYSGGFDTFPDERYRHEPREWTAEIYADEQTREPWPLFLRSLTPAEELASSLIHRGHALEAHERFDEAWSNYAGASQLAPHNDFYLHLCKECHRLELDQALAPWGMGGLRFCHLWQERLTGWDVRFPWEDAKGEPIAGVGPFSTPAIASLLQRTIHVHGVATRLAGQANLPKVMQQYVQSPPIVWGPNAAKSLIAMHNAARGFPMESRGAASSDTCIPRSRSVRRPEPIPAMSQGPPAPVGTTARRAASPARYASSHSPLETFTICSEEL